jgi:hypothetical protein
MGSSSSSTSSNEDPNIEASERFNFRFTDCSCKCDASKRRAGDVYGQHDVPQAAFLTALMAQIGQSQYDIRKHDYDSSKDKIKISRLRL